MTTGELRTTSYNPALTPVKGVPKPPPVIAPVIAPLEKESPAPPPTPSAVLIENQLGNATLNWDMGLDDEVETPTVKSTKPITKPVTTENVTKSPAPPNTTSIIAQIDKLAGSSDTDVLFTKAFSKHGRIRQEAVGKLTELRDKNLAILNNWNGPTEVKQALAKQLQSYDFSKMDGKASITDFSPSAQAAVEQAIDKLPPAQRSKARELQQALNVNFQQSFPEVKLATVRHDHLVGLLAQNEARIAKAQAAATETLESATPPSPEALQKLKDEALSALKSTQETYSIWMNKAPEDNVLQQSRKGDAEESQEVALLNLLQQRLQSTGPQPKLDQEIDKTLKSIAPSSADLGPLKNLAGQYQKLSQALDIQQRLIGSTFNQQKAQAMAEMHAEKHPEQAVGVIDKGWGNGKHQGYQVISYPAAQFAEKSKQAGQPGQPLIQLMKAGQVSQTKVAEKLPSTFAKGRISPLIINNERFQGKILEEVGQRAKTLAESNYKTAIKNYDALLASDDALLATLIAEHQKGGNDLQKLLEGMFAVSPHGSHAGEKSVPAVVGQLQQMLTNTRLELKNGNEDAAMTCVQKFLNSVQFKAVREGATEVKESLEKALKETQGLSNEEAAFELTAKLPTVREEVFRQCHFKLDPTTGIPPMKPDELEVRLEHEQFSSSAEAVFAKRAQSWKTKQELIGIAKTGGMVAASVALAVATGGAGGAAVAAGAISQGTLAVIGTGLAVATTLGTTAHQLSNARDEYQTAQANHAAKMLSFEGLKEADKQLTMAYMSAVVQVGMAGVSMGTSAAINQAALAPQTAAQVLGKEISAATVASAKQIGRAVATDVGLNAFGTLLDPHTYQGNAKDFAVNLVLGATISAVTNTTGAVVSSLVQKGQQVHIVADPENGTFMLQGAGDEPLAVRPIGMVDENNMRFEAPDGTQFSTRIDDTKAQLVKKIDTFDYDDIEVGKPVTQTLVDTTEQLRATAKAEIEETGINVKNVRELGIENIDGMPSSAKGSPSGMDKVKNAQVALDKFEQILWEQAPELDNDLKLKYLQAVKTEAAKPQNAGKPIREILRNVRANDAKTHQFLLQGEPIPLTELQKKGNFSRVVGIKSVYKYHLKQEKLDAVNRELGLEFEQKYGRKPILDPKVKGNDVDALGKMFAAKVKQDSTYFNPKTDIDTTTKLGGSHDVGWWSPKGESKATTMGELVDECALVAADYEGGGIRISVTPETAHEAGFRKSTALDGTQFNEWGEAKTGDAFGVTTGGVTEAVVQPIAIGDNEIEYFTWK